MRGWHQWPWVQNLLAHDKPIKPTEMPHILICSEMTTDYTNNPTQDDKYPWLNPDDKWYLMTDGEILNDKQIEEFLVLEFLVLEMR